MSAATASVATLSIQREGRAAAPWPSPPPERDAVRAPPDRPCITPAEPPSTMLDRPLDVDDDDDPPEADGDDAAAATVWCRLVDPPIELREERARGCGGRAWHAGHVTNAHLLFCDAMLRGAAAPVWPRADPRFAAQYPTAAHAAKHLAPAAPLGLGRAPRAIIELGTGTGLCGLLAARLWPDAAVVLTDLPSLLPVAAANVARHRQALDAWAAPAAAAAAPPATVAPRPAVRMAPVAVAPYDWTAPVLPASVSGPFDLVIVSDGVYLEALFTPLAQAIDALPLTPDACVLLVSTKRRAADRHFAKAMSKAFVLRRVVFDPACWQAADQATTVFYAHRKPAASA
ncbi:hypothetical protein CXG81DRAFT_27955 [Caulochytrium protostelioides]|uniref:S-adenosyl-L-methionine-dependent methyltransferase n=1 Tax=Caulochytrium protostelioides TaxID=1555241 RepID=A0A4P9X229_9FUNG|nr:hypothetical protein CXG81DRAFT_27955 [Caulochytrium protostelioides]|eukprot:RKO99275.1 hypothetical protein CXG81DRAFT_27955 [Caulochytrium protostelioides]